MNSAKTSLLVFSVLFGGALLGKYSSSFLSAEHLRGVELGVGLLTSMFGLLLSLQLSAGKTYFDNQEQDVTLMASRVLLLDDVLARYGSEAREAREILQDRVADLLTRVCRMDHLQPQHGLRPVGFRSSTGLKSCHQRMKTSDQKRR